MSTNHTPGPWFANESVSTPDFWAVSAKNGYGDLTTDITYVTLGGEKTEANARLIAAAPTMYDAMLNAIACAGHGTGARQELAAQIIEILSPAIAKAIRA